MIKIYNNIDMEILKKYNKIRDYKDKKAVIWFWTAPCNCYSNTNHNDGGNYHSQLFFYKFDIENKDVFLLIKTDTRDKFFSTTKKYIFYLGEHYYLLLELEEWEEVIYYEIVEF